MRVQFKTGMVGPGVFLAVVLAAGPARADITVHCKFQLLNGDTLTRASYYDESRVRMTMSDGNEIIYDAKGQEVVFLSHAKKRFWKGPLTRANAIIDSLANERYQAFFSASPEQQQKWSAFVSKFNESLKSEALDYVKKIAGRNCEGYMISAGKIVVHTRWIARGIPMPDYLPQIEKLALIPTLDPAGRAIVQLIARAEKGNGLPLGASTEINTMTQKGKFSWEAYTLDTRDIPDTVWQIPEGYEEIKP